MKLSIFTTVTDPERRGDPHKEALDCYQNLADEVVIVNGGNPLMDYSEYHFGKLKTANYKWPKEFKWTFIADQFQRGYEACTGDWVIHADLDFIFHEQDFDRIRQACINNPDAPGLQFWKYQFFIPTKYNLKSRMVLCVNKGVYGERIKFDGGGMGDLCQPSLDGLPIDPVQMPDVAVPFYNYDEMWKTKEQLLEDKGRFARAWQRTFDNWKLGGPDDESAYDSWWKMVTGRFEKHQDFTETHPKFVKKALSELQSNQFGRDMFGYVKSR